MLEPISIDVVSLNLPSLLPMAILSVGALSVICADLAVKGLNRSFLTMITVLFIILDFGAVIGYNGPSRGFFDVLLCRWDCYYCASDYSCCFSIFLAVVS